MKLYFNKITISEKEKNIKIFIIFYLGTNFFLKLKKIEFRLSKTVRLTR